MLFELEEMEGGEIKSLFHPMKLKQVNEERPSLTILLLIEIA